MDLINTWLRGAKNYLVGVRLYNSVGTDADLKRLFNSEAETPFKRQKLIAALQAIAQGEIKPDPEPETLLEPPPVEDAPTLVTFKKQWPEAACKTPDENQLWEKAVVLLKERAHLHATLFHQPNDDARRVIAFQIMRKDDELSALYSNRKFLLQHGRLPEQETKSKEFVTDPFLMAKRVNNLQRYINREKNPERKAEFIAEYNHYAKQMGKEEVTC